MNGFLQMMLVQKWLEYVHEEYGSIDECDDPQMIRDVRRECEAWFWLDHKVVNSADADDVELLSSWSNLIKNDKEIVTKTFMKCNKWLNDRGLQDYIN